MDLANISVVEIPSDYTSFENWIRQAKESWSAYRRSGAFEVGSTSPQFRSETEWFVANIKGYSKNKSGKVCAIYIGNKQYSLKAAIAKTKQEFDQVQGVN